MKSYNVSKHIYPSDCSKAYPVQIFEEIHNCLRQNITCLAEIMKSITKDDDCGILLFYYVLVMCCKPLFVYMFNVINGTVFGHQRYTVSQKKTRDHVFDNKLN